MYQIRKMHAQKALYINVIKVQVTVVIVPAYLEIEIQTEPFNITT